ncbi:drug resistance transporter, EmrB/QacA subfamily [Desulfofarcimen acetoxidans DSM 771]|uniref:Drug resistance transporter, EmrB/QacA subfamily n=1 Tax=Desulfofarcimen acetoxidans (strain ATCC 49208 / DSM 771 / KCTC 5769 / VKM B-1644 / 5575) TaxID=485916 RepID=C8W084_DESAS|nr:DHA2 family efflux MFS transporter permease subunit [Desulfofarcimen acetoxidans]ACV63139.1 drug resistance transporter, EmrB/QacA subfamily [Desulfofarcimen acetoxidans DSM 771]
MTSSYNAEEKNHMNNQNNQESKDSPSGAPEKHSPPPGPPGGTPGQPDNDNIPWGALLILVLGAFMAILDTSIVNVALPKMMVIFGASADEIQWILTGYMLTSGMVIPMTGFLGDRYGNKLMYIWSLIIFTIGSALCGLAWSNNSMIAFRVIQAIGGGMVMPVTMAIIYRIVPMRKIGTALGVWGIGAIMGPAIGPTLGGYLVDKFSWHWIFTINIPVGILTIILAYVLLKETPLMPHLKIDIPGMILSSSGCFCLLLALSKGQDEGWTSEYIVTLLVLSFFLILLFILWELQCEHPLLEVRLLKNKVIVASLLSTSLVTVGLFSAVFLVPIYAQNLMGYTPMQTGLMMMPAALVTGFMMPISGKLFDKYGALPLGLVGLTILAVLTYQMKYISTDTTFTHVQVLLSIRAIGLGLAMMPLTTAGMNTVPRFLVSRASALNNVVRQISGSMGIAYLTYVMLQRQTYHTVWLKEAVNVSSPGAALTQKTLVSYLAGMGYTGEAGNQAALSIMSSMVTKQAYMNGIQDAFIVSALLVVISLPLLFMLSKKQVDQQRDIENNRYAHQAVPPHGLPAAKPETAKA